MIAYVIAIPDHFSHPSHAAGPAPLHTAVRPLLPGPAPGLRPAHRTPVWICAIPDIPQRATR